MDASHERRKSPRFTLRIPIAVTLPDDETTEITSLTRDVSAHGVCFYLNEALAPTSPIRFRMTLPPEITLTDGIEVDCSGSVVWVEPTPGRDAMSVAATIERCVMGTR